jgi:hypothetical protein
MHYLNLEGMKTRQYYECYYIVAKTAFHAMVPKQLVVKEEAEWKSVVSPPSHAKKKSNFMFGVGDDVYKIANAIGTKYDTGAKQRWFKITNLNYPTTCGITGCLSDAEETSHVYVDGYFSCLYLLPVCKAHSHQTDMNCHIPKGSDVRCPSRTKTKSGAVLAKNGRDPYARIEKAVEDQMQSKRIYRKCMPNEKQREYLIALNSVDDYVKATHNASDCWVMVVMDLCPGCTAALPIYCKFARRTKTKNPNSKFYVVHIDDVPPYVDAMSEYLPLIIHAAAHGDFKIQCLTILTRQ